MAGSIRLLVPTPDNNKRSEVKVKKVSERYFGRPLGNTQDPDELYDHSDPNTNKEGMRIGGRGAQGGGSKTIPQRTLMQRGSGALHGSYPKNAHKLRG